MGLDDKRGEGYNQDALDAASREVHMMLLREGSSWGTKACEEMGRVFMTAYLKAAPSHVAPHPIADNATEGEKHLAFEWLREMATGGLIGPKSQRLAGIAFDEWHRLAAPSTVAPINAEAAGDVAPQAGGTTQPCPRPAAEAPVSSKALTGDRCPVCSDVPVLRFDGHTADYECTACGVVFGTDEIVSINAKLARLSATLPSMDNNYEWNEAFEAHMTLTEAISERNTQKFHAALLRLLCRADGGTNG